MDTGRQKSLLRSEMKRLRRDLGEDRRRAIGHEAQKILLASPLWQHSGTIALFVSFGDEISTARLLERAWREGKTLLLPKVDGNDMVFMPCASFDELKPGKFGIHEPMSACPAKCADIMIMPGLAFDCEGGRLGYGGGYYDRFLAENPNFCANRIGLCFAAQIVAHVPRLQADIPVNQICSENGLMINHGAAQL